MRYSTLQFIQRFLTLIVIITLLALVYIAARSAGYEVPSSNIWQLLNTETPIPPLQVAIISGHAGSDSGAICTDEDGGVTLTEVELNAKIAQSVAAKLRASETSIDVIILDEKDDRLDSLQVDVMLSLHSDSCIELSGFKAVSDPNSIIPEQQQKLITCINNRYADTTKLSYHPTTITHDMLGYHAFRRIDPYTPAAILEMGFMGGDQQLLTTGSETVAQGIADSLLCFLNNELWPEQTEVEPNVPQEELQQN